MKKLLTTITLCTLVGTSASSLKPVFTNNVVSHGFKSNQLNNKDISIKNENDKNPFVPRQINKFDGISIKCNTFSTKGVIYLGTDKGLYKSTDGFNFKSIGNLTDKTITSIAITDDGIVLVGTDKGLYKSTDDENLFNIISWTSNKKVNSISIVNGKTIYTHIGREIYRTSNITNYELPLFGYLQDANSCFIKNKNNNYFFGTSQGLWISTDGITFNIATTMKDINISSLATDKNGNVYAGSDNGNVYKSNGIDAFKPMIGTSGLVSSLATDKNGNVYAGSDNGNVYKSNGIDAFKPMIGTSGLVSSLATDKNGNVYAGSDNVLWIINPINLLLNINNDGFYADKNNYTYGGIVYNLLQKIDIKNKLIETATLDNKNITLPATELDITIGEHTLILTLKDEYKRYDELFDGKNGQVTYKLWVKTSINKNKINYNTNVDDTDLLTGLVSDLGNTNNAQVIQTRVKKGSGVHPANLNINFNDDLIDYPNSFYVLGRVDEITNDFTETGTHQIFSKNLNINTDGIYHLHLIDVVGNTYDSYLELGENNWKLQGKFDDQILNDKANKLNVTVDSHSASQEVKQEANAWLDNYKNIADSTFNNTVLTKGKGFNISIDSDLKGDYKSFLDPVTYIDSKTQYAINQTKLDKVINDIAEKKLQDGLAKLPQNLNVDTRNVVNKSTLDSYTNWINNYQNFINQNKDKWINDIEKIASRGFASHEQENQIKEKIRNLLDNSNIKNYLKNVVWEDNKLLKATSNDYQQYIELDKLQTNTINWVNTNMKAINIAYQNAIAQAESGLNLHGYTISQILNGQQKPQTKNEIDNFADGQSYHDWLQAQSNIKFHGWQLTMGLSIAIPLFLFAVAIGFFIRWRINPKYHGYWRGKKEDKKEDKLLIKSIKSPKKENDNYKYVYKKYCHKK